MFNFIKLIKVKLAIIFVAFNETIVILIIE